MGEMRRLWKGTTEFGTRDLPPDDTWKTNRHHSAMKQLFRDHSNQAIGVEHPIFEDTAVKFVHEQRRSSLPVMSCFKDSQRERETRGGLASTILRAPTTTTPPVLQHPKALTP